MRAFYDMFREQGIDEVFCLSVNDAFVMNAWGKDQGIEKVKLIPDGNGSLLVTWDCSLRSST